MGNRTKKRRVKRNRFGSGREGKGEEKGMKWRELKATERIRGHHLPPLPSLSILLIIINVYTFCTSVILRFVGRPYFVMVQASVHFYTVAILTWLTLPPRSSSLIPLRGYPVLQRWQVVLKTTQAWIFAKRLRCWLWWLSAAISSISLTVSLSGRVTRQFCAFEESGNDK